MPLLVVLLWGMFVLLQLGRWQIILSRILLFVPWSYLVLGSLCLVCPVVLSSGFFLGCVFFWPFSSSYMPQLFLGFHLSCAFGYLPSLSFLWSYISPHILCVLYHFSTLLHQSSCRRWYFWVFLFLCLFCYAQCTLLDNFSDVLI